MPSLRQLPSGGYEVRWTRTRTYPTLAEAQEAVKLRSPPPPRPRTYLHPKLRTLIVQLVEGGIAPATIATALGEAGVPGARGGRWYAATIRKLVASAQRERAECDAKAVAAEHRADDDDRRPG